ncbi:MAG: PEP-CTERM sorting domain-containing protein [Planctomycetes bacterium]|nr:PEP-CTERM sorting domain-containing protein [Planctomycetota bacterium]
MKTVVAIIAVLGAAVPVLADWIPGDPYKMHFPQLPDPNGWDVKANYSKVLADDWLCTETGPVSDVHFWGSWYGDIVGAISWVQISIHADIPDPDGPGPEYSKPGELLWLQVFYPTQFTVRPWDTGQQGWYDPNLEYWRRPDHSQTWQYNIVNIPDPFIQQKGTVYWLDISVESNYGEWGWKTSYLHFNDDAVWADYVPGGQTPWQELRDPITGQSLDLAFVITPEPATVVLLLGGLALLRRFRRA